MYTNPLQQPCSHIATPGEHDRDPNYLSCNAQPGQPCVWAARYDGVVDPLFHSERIEAAANAGTPPSALDSEHFRQDVLESGLV